MIPAIAPEPVMAIIWFLRLFAFFCSPETQVDHIGVFIAPHIIGTTPSVAAPAAAYLLDDASLIILPARQELSARHELINGIGVAPDYYLPLTAHDLSTGHDPDIAKALALLGGR